MSDHRITILPMLGGDLAALEYRLVERTRDEPIALILPCHVDELASAALARIIDTLKGISWISRIVIGLDGASAEDVAHARSLFACLDAPKKRTIMLWNDGPAVGAYLDELMTHVPFPQAAGKGRNVWLCLGAAFAATATAPDGTPGIRTIAFHDCDIATYDRALLARLCAPVSTLGFAFCKGYAPRFADVLYGRVSRMHFLPLLEAFRQWTGGTPLLDFLSGFIQPLAGETALTAALAGDLEIPAHWGIEVGMLARVAALCPASEVCQVQIAERYDHKHRALVSSEREGGLFRMASEITHTLLEDLRDEAAAGHTLDVVTPEAFAPYLAHANEGRLRRDEAVALVNGLQWDPEAEEFGSQYFTEAVFEALRRQQPASGDLGMMLPTLPSWNTIRMKWPGALAALRTVAE